MKIETTEFKDVLLITPKSYQDKRGDFRESFRLDKINQALNREICFCQDNLARSKRES